MIMSETPDITYAWWISVEFSKKLPTPTVEYDPITGVQTVRSSVSDTSWRAGRFSVSADTPVSRHDLLITLVDDMVTDLGGKYTKDHARLIGWGCDRDIV